MGKVILIHAGGWLREKRLIHFTLYKVAVFALLLVCFEVVEEVIIGLIHGKSIVASLLQPGGGGLEGKILVSIIAFVVLIPFFLFPEPERVLGKESLHPLILQSRSKADAA